jgi:hypothetical protein
MARSRLLKPGFFLNERLAELPFEGRLLFAGDVVMNESFVAATAVSSMKTWLAAFDAFEAMKPRTIVPAHGAVGPGTIIATNRAILQAVRTRALALKAEGRSIDETATAVQTELSAQHPGWPRAGGLAALARSAFNGSASGPAFRLSGRACRRHGGHAESEAKAVSAGAGRPDRSALTIRRDRSGRSGPGLLHALHSSSPCPSCRRTQQALHAGSASPVAACRSTRQPQKSLDDVGRRWARGRSVSFDVGAILPEHRRPLASARRAPALRRRESALFWCRSGRNLIERGSAKRDLGRRSALSNSSQSART